MNFLERRLREEVERASNDGSMPGFDAETREQLVYNPAFDSLWMIGRDLLRLQAICAAGIVALALFNPVLGTAAGWTCVLCSEAPFAWLGIWRGMRRRDARERLAELATLPWKPARLKWFAMAPATGALRVGIQWIRAAAVAATMLLAWPFWHGASFWHIIFAVLALFAMTLAGTFAPRAQLIGWRLAFRCDAREAAVLSLLASARLALGCAATLAPLFAFFLAVIWLEWGTASSLAAVLLSVPFAWLTHRQTMLLGDAIPLKWAEEDDAELDRAGAEALLSPEQLARSAARATFLDILWPMKPPPTAIEQARAAAPPDGPPWRERLGSNAP